MTRLEILNLASRAIDYMRITYPIRVEAVSGTDSPKHKKAIALAADLLIANSFIQAEIKQLEAESQVQK